ncbi:acyl-CoA dehydrogenase family protein [Acrocarpospora macrocephala]|uniref:Acyl-CoA dehydrogenase n=1 Tax=Acrocarpospora macrocephala TaxID=150177 RepID=A0A5M3WQ86_9ACTN|nr:acyl-CoA dehydrogenase family protein [Acrocarpospora macrocephala]GES10302.1 acyl-CoA dehydrogenase [Acrocarpospora macrocephala]
MNRLSEEEFHREAAEFLDSYTSRRSGGTGRPVWGQGDDRVSVVAERAEGEQEEIARLKDYRAALDRAGLAWINGPAAYGGRELPTPYATAFRELESQYDLPDDGYTRFSVSTFCPALLTHGSDFLKTTYLRRLRTAGLLACQLFSEPGAGSDLAGLTTRAERRGDGWVLNGQKVWSSGAHYSDLGLCIARTNRDAPKHAGLSTFLVDMRAPGVEIRPIRQLTGGASFDEVFLTDVYVPDDHRLGEVDQGWRVVVDVLLNERGAIGLESGLDEELLARLVDLARHTGAARDARIRDALADLHIRSWAARETTARMLSGGVPGPELAVTKLILTDLLRRAGDIAADALGAALVADTGEWGTYAWSELILGLPGLRVGGGTDEIMRNAVGERVLGLPKDAR